MTHAIVARELAPFPSCADGRFRIGHLIGAGTRCRVFSGCDRISGNAVAIKLEPMLPGHSNLLAEYYFYQHQPSPSPGVPTAFWFGQHSIYWVLVTELLGPTLEQLLECQPEQFSVRTVLMITNKLISTIKNVHRTDFAHCSIKPSNIAVGIDGNSIYFAGFGSSKPIVDNSMLQTDMVSIAKLAIFMLHRSILGKKDHFDSFINSSIFTSNRKLCRGLPVEFCHVLNYCHELQVHERPDYNLVRNHLRDFHFRSGFRADDFFDWKHAQPGISAKNEK